MKKKSAKSSYLYWNLPRTRSLLVFFVCSCCFQGLNTYSFQDIPSGYIGAQGANQAKGLEQYQKANQWQPLASLRMKMKMFTFWGLEICETLRLYFHPVCLACGQLCVFLQKKVSGLILVMCATFTHISSHGKSTG